jgi:hypothetical protein
MFGNMSQPKRCEHLTNIKILPGPQTVPRGIMNEINVFDMVQDREMWRALVNAVMNLRVP